MSKTLLKHKLSDIRTAIPLKTLKQDKVTKTWVRCAALRYQLLRYLGEWLRVSGQAANIRITPTPEDWLILAPLTTRSGERVNPVALVQKVYDRTVVDVRAGIDSLTHLALLYLNATTCKMIDIVDLRDAEFIKAVPRTKERPLKAYSCGNFTIYFVDDRFAILLNRETKKNREVDDNFFAVVYDLGGVLPYIIEGRLAMPEISSSTTFCRLDKFPITAPQTYTNKKLDLWEQVVSPVGYSWFVESKVSRRSPLYAINYSRVVIEGHSGVGIPNADWENLVKVFAVPTLTQLRKEKT